MTKGAGDAFGALLRRHRLAAGLTQEGLAERAGVSARAVSDLERGGGRAPRFETVALLAAALGLLPEERRTLLAAARPEAGATPRPMAEPPAARFGTLPSVVLPEPSPLFGRDRERARLAACLDATLAGRGRLVLIGGEAGIGKTTLAEALLHDAVVREVRVLIGRCYDLTETPPYGPWLDLFARYPHGDDPPLPTTFARRGMVGAVTSQAALIGQVLDFFASLATERPLVLLLDDLHWADPASLDLLRVLVRSLPALPLLVAATYRPDELSATHPFARLLPALVRESPVERLDLRPLRVDDVATLVAARYRLTDEGTARLTTYAHQRSEGNPLFLGELLRTLEEEEVMQRTSTGWTLGFLTDVRVPPLLRQIIEGRAARLDGEARRLLAIAAVLGQQVPLDLWAGVAAVTEEMLLPTIAQASAARLGEATADGAGMRFVHALIREALYEGMTPPERRLVHRAAGEALAAGHDPDPDTVANHFQRAGDARAAAWLVRAGDRAGWLYAWTTATERYEAALAMMERDGADAQDRAALLAAMAEVGRYAEPQAGIALLNEAYHLAVSAGDNALAGWCLFRRGVLRYFIGEQERSLADMAAGVEVIEALPANNDPRPVPGWMRQEGAVIGSPRGTFMILVAKLGHFREIVSMADRFSAGMPVTLGDPYGDGLWGLGNAYCALGRPAESRTAFQRARAIFRGMGHHFVLGFLAADELRTVLAYETGRWDERWELAEMSQDAFRKASEADAAFSVRSGLLSLLMVEGAWSDVRQTLEQIAATARPWWDHHSGFGALLREQGDTGRAWEWIQAEMPEGAGTRPGTRMFVLAVAVQRVAASLALDEGDLATAKEWLDAHDRWLTWSGAVLWRSEGAALWARYHRIGGDAEGARAYAQRALVHASEPRQPLALLAAHRLLGELATDTGHFDDAATHLDEALTLADACAAPYERALTLLSLAELRTLSSDVVAASSVLEEVRTISASLGAKPALARADALATRIAAAKVALPAYPAGLSAREVEVLRLVADGLSNPQIGERLFLSPRTIEHHLHSIFNKTGVPSRAAAAHWAAEHALG